MAPYLEHWDLAGDTFVSRAEPVPADATGAFELPEGDPGISSIYRAFVNASGSFDRVNGDDALWLAFAEGAPTAGGYLATEPPARDRRVSATARDPRPPLRRIARVERACPRATAARLRHGLAEKCPRESENRGGPPLALSRA